MRHEITNPTEAKEAAKQIREALKNNCLYIYAADIRDNTEYRIKNVTLYNGTLLADAVNGRKNFPVKYWEQR